MKITQKHIDIQPVNKLVLAFDVSKDRLHCFGELKNRNIEDSFPNVTSRIEQKLVAYSGLADSVGLLGVHIVAEPTGGYHKKLLRTARRLGHTTALVNAESVSKLRVVESNDSGKTDRKDPRIILMLSKLGKTLTHRELKGEYLLLRQWNKIYDCEERELVKIRNQIHCYLVELYCDYSFKKDFLYDKSGRALMKLYGFNPYRIIRSGYVRFCKRMRKEAPGVRESTLRRLWEDASTSVLQRMDSEYVALLEMRIRQLWSDYLLREERRQNIREKMIELYHRLRRKDAHIPRARKGVIKEFWIARLLGETGPLDDFSNSKKLMRYAGLNIRERKSGKYAGQNRISKKGRPSLRKVLGQVVFPLVKKGNLFGEIYHGKKEQGMSGPKAMVVVERKFLKMFYGWYRSGREFDIDRVFRSRSEYVCPA